MLSSVTRLLVMTTRDAARGPCGLGKSPHRLFFVSRLLGDCASQSDPFVVSVVYYFNCAHALYSNVSIVNIKILYAVLAAILFAQVSM